MYQHQSPHSPRGGSGGGGHHQGEGVADPAAASSYYYAEQPPPQQVYYQGANPPVYVYDGQPQAHPPVMMEGGGYGGKPPAAAHMGMGMGMAGGGGGGGGDDWDLEAAQAQATESAYIAKAEAAMRVAFMRKVYGILLTQLLATIGMAVLFMFEPSVNAFVVSSPRLLIAGLVLSLVTLVALICLRHKHPANLILLGVWTLVEAYTLGVVCAFYQRSGAGEIVLQAFIITAAIFVGLTLFTLYSKIDFSWLGAFCFAGLMGMLAWGIIIWIMGWRQSFIYSLLGAILFSLLIVYDTFMISKKLSPDEYILGAISLYLDILNLFLYLLQILSNRRD